MLCGVREPYLGWRCSSVIVSVSGWGQTITSTIVGQVNDPSGAAVPEAKVIAKNVETGIATEGASDSSGAYPIPQLQPGIYDVTVIKTGFVTHAVTGIGVLSSQTVRVDMKLDLGADATDRVRQRARRPWFIRIRKASPIAFPPGLLKTFPSRLNPSTR